MVIVSQSIRHGMMFDMLGIFFYLSDRGFKLPVIDIDRGRHGDTFPEIPLYIND
jgi:hypothetical protein